MYRNGTSSDIIAKDMNSMLHSFVSKHHPLDNEFAKIKELGTSGSYSNTIRHEQDQIQNQNLNLNQMQNKNQNQNQNQQHVLGGQAAGSLMRYRSAPSTFYANLLDDDDFLDPLETSLKPDETFFFGQQQQQQQYPSDSDEFLNYISSSSSMKREQKEANIQNLDLQPNLPTIQNNGIYNPSSHNNLQSSSTYRSMNSNLVRQSSSPAGFLSSLDAETGFTSTRNVEKAPTLSRLSNHIAFSSKPSSSSMFLPQIVTNTSEVKDPAVRSLKRSHNGDLVTSDRQNGISGHTPTLIHHMSLPKTFSEMATAQKILRFDQDTVPCKMRAKRGCATHPRSIAERVRRTRITDRMKKLQELFPTIDKQTSTADMLDMSVQYIKNLQKDLQTLNDARQRCTCSNKQSKTG